MPSLCKVERNKAAFHGLLSSLALIKMGSLDPEEDEFHFCVAAAWAGFHLGATLIHLRRMTKAA